MKRCIICGNTGDDSSTVCSVCGNPYVDMSDSFGEDFEENLQEENQSADQKEDPAAGEAASEKAEQARETSEKAEEEPPEALEKRTEEPPADSEKAAEPKENRPAQEKKAYGTAPGQQEAQRAGRPARATGAARDRRFTDRGKQTPTARGGPGRRQADRPEELIPERERLRPGSPRALRNPAEQPQKEQPGEDRYKGREDRPRTRGDRRQAELRERKGQLRAGRQAQKTYSPAVQLRAEALPSSSLEAPGRLCREICLRETGSLIHGSPSRLRVCIPREELRDMEITVYGKRPERPCILPCSVLWLFCTPLF